MKDFWEEQQIEKKKVNKKKIIISIIILVIVAVLGTVIGVYLNNDSFRDWIDRNILRKEVMQDNVTTIDLEDSQTANIVAFNRYIGILNKNTFSIYGSSGNEEASLEVQVSNPLFNSSDRFLAIAENGGKKVYIIENRDISWQTEVEGNILQVVVNKNGYVAIVTEDTINKAVIALYTPQGKQLFNVYLSSTRAVDVSISNDNKYLAVAEVDTSGTMIKSSIRVISVEKASSDPTNSVESTYQSENDKLLTNIKYQDRNKLVCMYTDELRVIEDGQDNLLIDDSDKTLIAESIELDNYACIVEEQSSGLFTANSKVTIIDTNNKETKEYSAESVAGEIYTNGNIIALNLGTEVEFINTGGWLVKRYVANQEITNVVLSQNLAGIVYRDKIELVSL